MTDRYTQKDAAAAFERLRVALGKPAGHYREISDEERASGKTYATIPGGWALTHSTYGGYVIEEIDDRGGTGVRHPLGERRRSAREFVDAARFALDTLALAQSQMLSNDDDEDYSYEIGERVIVSDVNGEREADITDQDMKDGQLTYGFDDGTWCYEDDIIRSVAIPANSDDAALEEEDARDADARHADQIEESAAYWEERRNNGE